MSRTSTIKLARRSKKRLDRIFRRVNALERDILRVVAVWEGQVLSGLMDSKAPTVPQVRDALFTGLVDIQRVLGRGLEELFHYSHGQAKRDLWATLPRSVLLRIARRKLGVRRTQEGVQLMERVSKRTEEKIKAGERLTDRQFAELFDELVAPPVPSKKVNQLLRRSIWGDTLTWEQRIQGLGRHENFRTIARQLTRGISEGENVQQLSKRLTPLMDGVRYRARRIARTEAGRVAELANRETWSNLGDESNAVQVLAVVDSHTRPHHLERHGRVYKAHVSGEFIADNGDVLPALPDAPNCVLPGTIVEGAVEAASKAYYTGQAIEFTTERGSVVRVTPNHPVLSYVGFVPAKVLRKGFYLLTNISNVPRPVVMSNYIQNAPTLIEKIFCAFADNTSCFGANASPVDFHGEGAHIKGDVYVVWTTSKLRRAKFAMTPEPSDDFLLSDTGVQTKPLTGVSPCTLNSQTIGFSSPGSVGSSNLTENGTAALLDLPPLNSLCLGPASVDSTILNQVLDESERSAVLVGDTTTTNANLTSKFIDGLAGVVAADYIVDIRNFQYSGHVYDLQTTHGWYYANGVIIHNCRCWSTPVIDDPEAGAFDVSDERRREIDRRRNEESKVKT